MSDTYSSTLFTSFAVEVPHNNIWEIPDCFPSNSPLNLSSAPPVTPVPDSFSFTYTYNTNQEYTASIKTAYDKPSMRSRMSYIIDYSNSTIGNLGVDALFVGPYVYYLISWESIVPTPCIYFNSTNPAYTLMGDYYGTVSLGNQQQYFNIYGGLQDTFYAFDSVTNNLKAIYSFFQTYPVTYWNPTAPDPSIFTVPDKCYQIPMTDSNNNDGHNLGVSFPSSFTMRFLNPDLNVLYYNGDTQMWRHDYYSTISVQKGNMQYNFNSAFTSPKPSINPIPCTMNPKNFSFPVSYPSNYPTYFGTASYKGGSVDVWYSSKVVSYWVSSTPLLFLGGSEELTMIILDYQPGPPPMDVFNTPSLCIASFD